MTTPAPSAAHAIYYQRRGRTKAALPAALITLAFIGAIFLVVFLAPGAAAEPAAVYLESDGAHLTFTIRSASLGHVETTAANGGSSEAVTWTPLRVPAGTTEANGSPVLVAYGNTTLAAITDVRIEFSEVRLVLDGTLHHLRLEQDTLHVRFETAGAKGDALLIVLDGAGSISLQPGGVLVFTPRLLETAWGTGLAYEMRAPDRPDRPPGAPTGSPVGGGSLLPPTQGTDAPRPPPAVGRIELFLAGRSHGLVDHLNVTLSKVALTPAGGAAMTWHEGNAGFALVEASTAPRLFLASQVPVGTYESIQLESAGAIATFALTGAHVAIVPQPRLVLESGFAVTAGSTLQILVEIGIEESLRVSPAGLEYRPVVTRVLFGTTEYDTGLSSLLEPLPAQYRTDGSMLPSLGEPIGGVLDDAGVEPDSVLHPVLGDEDRPAGSNGSLVDPDVDPSLIEELTGPMPDANLA